MLRIRLARFGKKHQPFYRIVVIDSKRKVTGEYVEAIGWYNPMAKDKKDLYHIKMDRYEYWIKIGAKPSEAVLRLILPVEEKKRLWPDKPKQKKEQKNTSKDKSQDKE